jgi:hypothetical protein
MVSISSTDNVPIAAMASRRNEIAEMILARIDRRESIILILWMVCLVG